MTLPRAALFCLLVFGCASMAFTQTESATVSGRITDTDGAAVHGAQVQLESIEHGTTQKATTNDAGIYVFPGLLPGQYHMTVMKTGFRQVEVVGLVLNVQDHVEKNVRLQVGSVSESITVSAGTSLVNTEDASVSTVVDRNFAENLPLNGRSFQSLIYLTPGAVPTVAAGADSGQFSVNGQRASANYWTVDGVSANVASSAGGTGNQVGGAVGLTSVLGGTNSLVSVDAMQEFRIQTSTFAPEFGRTPGAQISIVTRSGTNKFHGSLFEYLRNDVFDAGDWFNGYTNKAPLPKAKERQNDFGGTFSGPIIADRTFFFFTFEGLRLRLPQTALTQVPCDSTCKVFGNSRNAAVPALQPYFNAYPLPNGPEVITASGTPTGTAQFNATYSNPATVNDYSIRIDHKITDKLSLFGRYNRSPSSDGSRGGGSTSVASLSTVLSVKNVAQQLTTGLTASISPHILNEFRFNYSRTSLTSLDVPDSFGGAVPLASVPLPSPYTLRNSFFVFDIFIPHGALFSGSGGSNLQRQFNLVDTISLQKSSHNLRLGIDYRRLTPVLRPGQYNQFAAFTSIANAENGKLFDSLLQTHAELTFLFRNLSMFAQDTWRATSALTLTYGLRWDTDFAPKTISGPALPAITGFGRDLSQLAIAQTGTPAINTSFGSVAPRIGVAYQLSQRQDWGLVAKGGFGVFYDLTTAEAGNVVQSAYPFTALAFHFNPSTPFPLSPAAAAPPPILPPSPGSPGRLGAYDPQFKAPYTLQWNVSLEQELGAQQVLSATYVGAAGRRLVQTAGILSPNPSFTDANIFTNGATSDYHALQVQFVRRLVKGLQTLSSYTWSHAIDSASTGNLSVGSNAAAALGNPANRASADFDIRHVFSTGITYSLPNLKSTPILKQVSYGWSLQSTIESQTARPIQLVDSDFNQLANGFNPDIWPDIVPGIPLYVYGSQYPGGKAFNNTVAKGACPGGANRIGAFCPPPTDANGNPTRQGTSGRNALRGFGLFQWDLAARGGSQEREEEDVWWWKQKCSRYCVWR